MKKLTKRGKTEVKEHRAQDKSGKRAQRSLASIERVIERSTSAAEAVTRIDGIVRAWRARA